ncbi:MAG: hypothetical protein IID44_08510 [Planctomycetes bacterium]|nr:hypothetical protein [Planctomycetota bacterium]
MIFSSRNTALTTWRWLAIGIVAIAWSSAGLLPTAPLRAAEPYDPLKVKGVLQKASEHLKKLTPLRWHNGKIKPGVLSDRDAVRKIVSDLRSLSGGGGGGSSSGGDSWSQSFQGSKMSGKVAFEGGGFLKASTFEVWLREESKPNRELTVKSNTRGRLSITLNGGDSPYLFRLYQQPNGKLIVQEISGDQVFSQQEDSFAEFCRIHVQFVQHRLIPLLEHLGIDAPITPYDKRVQSQVRRMLTPIAGEKLAKFKKIAVGLDSDEFKLREQATRDLTKQFDELADVMRHATLDETYSVEVRARLNEVIRKTSRPEDRRVYDLITKVKLTDKPRYLLWLLSETDDAQRPVIARRLAKVTGQNFGGDVARWRAWLKTQAADVKTTEKPAPPLDLLAKKGKLQAVSKHTARLVKLKWDGDRLRLDRQHWAKPFGGKTIKQLSDEVAAEVTKRGLPATWWNKVDGDDHVGYPDVLFQSMRNELETDRYSRYFYRGYGHGDGQSEFEANGISASLSTKKSAGRRVFGRRASTKQQKYFKFRLSETAAEKRTLLVQTDEKERLQISLLGEKSHSIVRLLEMPSGLWVVQDVRGTQVFAAKADSFRKLYDQNEEYFTKQFFPLLKHLGIVVAKSK